MSLAIAFTFETGIAVVLVDSLSFQIRQPGLNVSGWDEDRHPFIRLTSLGARFDAAVLNLFYPGSDVSPVGIDEYDQCLLDPVLSGAVVREFLLETFPYELLTCPAAFGTDFDPLHSDIFACSFQEPPSECLMLSVLTQDDHLNVSAHCSHPLATTSDSLNPPSTANSLAGRTVVAPEPPGCRTIPLSPPR